MTIPASEHPSTHLPPPLDTARFRAGGAYELVVLDRLNPEERAMFGELAADPDVYGVLRPTGAGGTYRTAGRDLALLLLTLAEPAPLPFFARDPQTAADVAALVLDGVLEVEHDGRFLGGAAATELIAGARPAVARHPLGRLAGEALHLAAELAARLTAHPAGDGGQGGAAARVAAFLYAFHRLPVDAGGERRWADREAVLAFLGRPAGTPARRELDAAWELAPPGEGSAGWLVFSGRDPRRRRRGDAACKLYLSPLPDALPRAFAALTDVLRRRPQRDFKVGADAAGLLRPDKLVAYFDDLESLLGVARALEERLAGTPAQGVPFSAPIDAAGLLSWGADPPPSARALSWQGAESWRTWLVGRLGALLVRGCRQTGGDPAAARSFALARLAREGVDVERWLPPAGLFRAA